MSKHSGALNHWLSTKHLLLPQLLKTTSTSQKGPLKLQCKEEIIWFIISMFYNILFLHLRKIGRRKTNCCRALLLNGQIIQVLKKSLQLFFLEDKGCNQKCLKRQCVTLSAILVWKKELASLLPQACNTEINILHQRFFRAKLILLTDLQDCEVYE